MSPVGPQTTWSHVIGQQTGKLPENQRLSFHVQMDICVNVIHSRMVQQPVCAKASGTVATSKSLNTGRRPQTRPAAEAQNSHTQVGRSSIPGSCNTKNTDESGNRPSFLNV